MIHKHIIITLLLLMFQTFLLTALGQPKVVAGKSVKLSGTCKYQLTYGPPNFGQTPKIDKKGYSYILYLDNPVMFKDDELGSGQWEKVSKVHIIDSEKKFKMSNYKNKHLNINCVLIAGHTAYHHASAITWELHNIQVK